MSERTWQRGATVVEMVILFAIGTTLLAAASPELSLLAANAQMRSAADSLRSGLRIAQREALSRQLPVELVLTDDAPRAAQVAPAADGSNWIVRAVRGDRSFELLASFSGADQTPRVLVKAERSVFAFDSFGRLRVDASGEAHARDAWRIAFDDRLAIARPLRVEVTTGGSSTTCDPSAGATDSFTCG